MPYSWETAVTDRTSTSTYEYTDPNRVDNNTRYLEEYIEAYIGYSVTLEAYTTSTKSTLGTAELINLLERNINELRDAIGYDPSDWNTLDESWAGGDSFLYSDANNLEEDLSLLKTNFENIYSSLRYCGTYYCGEDIGMVAVEELLT